MQTWRTAPPSLWKTCESPEDTCTPTGTCTQRALEQSNNRSVTLLPVGAVSIYSSNRSCSNRWLPTCTRTTTTCGSFTSPVTMRVSSTVYLHVSNKWSHVSKTKCSSLVCLPLSPVWDAWLGSSRWHHSTGTQRVSIQRAYIAFLLGALWHRLFMMFFSVLELNSHTFNMQCTPRDPIITFNVCPGRVVIFTVTSTRPQWPRSTSRSPAMAWWVSSLSWLRCLFYTWMD